MGFIMHRLKQVNHSVCAAFSVMVGINIQSNGDNRLFERKNDSLKMFKQLE